MDLRRESDGGRDQKRLFGGGLAGPAAYVTPKFTTLSAAKKCPNLQRQQKVYPKKLNKNGGFSIAELFLTDG